MFCVCVCVMKILVALKIEKNVFVSSYNDPKMSMMILSLKIE